jgi:hypothetical protein
MLLPISASAPQAQKRQLETLSSGTVMRVGIVYDTEPAKTHAECQERNGAWTLEVDDELTPIGGVCVERQ